MPTIIKKYFDSLKEAIDSLDVLKEKMFIWCGDYVNLSWENLDEGTKWLVYLKFDVLTDEDEILFKNWLVVHGNCEKCFHYTGTHTHTFGRGWSGFCVEERDQVNPNGLCEKFRSRNETRKKIKLIHLADSLIDRTYDEK